jgi:beta-glucosidase
MADFLGMDAGALRPRADAETGLFVEYWNNLDLTGEPEATRIDGVDVVWEGSPIAGVSEAFSARFRGWLIPPRDGIYDLTLRSDDGSRLWIDGTLLIDQWKGAPNEETQSVPLAQPVRIELQLFSLGGSASLQLFWSVDGGARELVPNDALRVP